MSAVAGAAKWLLTVAALLVGVSILVVVGGILAFRAKVGGPEYGWAKDHCKNGDVLVARLEEHFRATGTYPQNFVELAAFDGGIDHSSTHITSGETWRCARIAFNDFELACSLGRWLNISDWIVYSPDHTYPALWTEKSPYERRFGGWLYFREGANDSFLPSNESGYWDD